PEENNNSSCVMDIFIHKFKNKNIEELKLNLEDFTRNLRINCNEIRNIDLNDKDYLRKLVLLLKIINKILYDAKNNNLQFSWEEVILNLLHFESNPNLMINSMLREIKRKNSYKTRMLIKKRNYYNNLVSQNSNQRQKKILDYIF
ncbi:MAG: hypothetical protein P8Y70_16185, partial [Candidatus Lokiarchaeota archaeon]